MTKKFLFLARATPDSPSCDGQSEWVLVCESPTHVTIHPAPLNLPPSIPLVNSSAAHSPMPSFATPNSLLQARAWPLLGPRVTRPSRAPSLKGKSSLGMSSFLRGNKTK